MSVFDKLEYKQINDFLELPPLLRLLTGVGISQIIAGILIIGLKHIPIGSIRVFYWQGSPVTMSALLVWVIYFLNVIAWSYALIGTIHAYKMASLSLLSLFSFFMLQDSRSLVSAALILIIVVFIWIYIFRRRKHKDESIVLKDLCIIFFSVLMIHGINIVSAVFNIEVSAGQVNFLEIAFFKISGQMANTYLLLIPLLLITGLDMVELSINACRIVTEKTIGHLRGKSLYSVLGTISLISCYLLIHYFGLKISLLTSFVLMIGLIAVVHYLYRQRDSGEFTFKYMLLVTSSALAFLFIYAFFNAFIGGESADFTSILGWSSVIASSLWFIIGIFRMLVKKDFSRSTVTLLVLSLWYFVSIGIGAITKALGMTVVLTANIQYIILSGSIILLLCCIFSLVKKEISREFTLRLVSFNLVTLIIYLVSLLYESGAEIDISALYALIQSSLFLVLPAIIILKNAGRNRIFKSIVYVLLAVVIVLGMLIIFFPQTRKAIIEFMQLFLVSTALIWETMNFGERFKDSKKNKNKYYSNLALYFSYILFLIIGLIYHDGLNIKEIGFFDPDLISQFSCIIFGLPIAFLFLVGSDSSGSNSSISIV